jgi:hypothetical protein
MVVDITEIYDVQKETQFLTQMLKYERNESIRGLKIKPSNQERNLEARMKLADSQEQHMAVDARKDAESIE